MKDQDIVLIPSVSNMLLQSEGTFSKTKVDLQNFQQVIISWNRHEVLPYYIGDKEKLKWSASKCA